MAETRSSNRLEPLQMVHRKLVWVTMVRCLSHKREVLRLQLEIVTLDRWRMNSIPVGVLFIWTVVISQRSGSISLIDRLSSSCIISIGLNDYSPLRIYPLTCCITQMTLMVMQVSIIILYKN